MPIINEPATFTEFEEYSQSVTYFNDGRVSRVEAQPTISFVQDRFGSRSGSSSPIVTLPTGDKWRSPNSYTRGIIEDHYEGGVVKIIRQTSTSRSVTISKTRYRGGTSCDVPLFLKNGVYLPNYHQKAAAEMKALQKLADGKVSLSMIAAESRLTFSMLGERSIQAFHALRAMKRGNWRHAANILGFDTHSRRSHRKNGRKIVNNWSSFWLEYQYGWAPYLSDLAGIYDLAREYGSKPYFLVSGAGSVFETGGKSSTILAYQPYSYEASISRLYKTVLYGQVRSDAVHSASQLGLLNPLTIAWELVPFSFVVDWFIPIGSFLEALTGLAGVGFHSGTTTEVFDLKSVFREVSNDPNKSYISDRRLTRKGKAMQRTVLVQFPFPKLYIRNPVTSARVASAAALFHQIRMK